MHRWRGRGFGYFDSEAVSEIHTTTAHMLGKVSQSRGENVSLRLLTYKQSICSPWLPQPPLQTNPSKEMKIILADLALPQPLSGLRTHKEVGFRSNLLRE